MKTRISQSTWDSIKTAYASGVGLREQARNLCIPAGTLLARSKREQWTRQIAEAKLIERPELARELARPDAIEAISPMQSAAMSLRERGERHIQTMAGVIERTMPRVEAMDADEVLDHVEKVDRYDRLARRQYGLDAMSGDKIGLLQINFLSSGIESSGTVIEVEPGENEP